jgi:hypothetical protein
MFFLRAFLEPHATAYHSNIGVPNIVCGEKTSLRAKYRCPKATSSKTFHFHNQCPRRCLGIIVKTRVFSKSNRLHVDIFPKKNLISLRYFSYIPSKQSVIVLESYTRDIELVTIALQALSLVEKAEPMQGRFTLGLRDQRSSM